MIDFSDVLNKKVDALFLDEEIENKYGKTRALFYTGEEYKGESTEIFAYLGIPDGKAPSGGFPAVVLCHGGGGCAFYEWVEFWNKKGYVAIAPDFYSQQFGSTKTDGNGKAPKNPLGGPINTGSFYDNCENYKDGWIYHRVSDIILAHNILLSLDSVNKEKTCITGISWGSVLTLIASGADNRFKAFAPVYGSGYLLKTAGVKYVEKVLKVDDEKEYNSLFDPVSYLENEDKPIIFTVGTDDIFFNPKFGELSARLCGGKTLRSFRLSLPHYHRWKDEEGMICVYDFFENVLFKKPLKFYVEEDGASHGKIYAKIFGIEKVKSARLVYTLDDKEDSRQNVWYTKEIDVNKAESGRVAVAVPEKTDAAFIELSDKAEKEFVLSTKMYFNKEIF